MCRDDISDMSATDKNVSHLRGVAYRHIHQHCQPRWGGKEYDETSLFDKPGLAEGNADESGMAMASKTGNGGL